MVAGKKLEAILFPKGEPNWEKYEAPAMKLAASDEVLAKQMMEKFIAASKKGQNLKKEAMELGMDAMMMKEGEDFFEGFDKKGHFKNKGGYVKWIKNKTAMKILDDLYDVKEALKAIITDKKLMETDRKLGMAVLERPEIKQMGKMLMNDMGIKTCEDAMARLMKIGMMLKKMEKDCPYRERLEKMFTKLWTAAEDTKEVFDIRPKMWKAWAKKSKWIDDKGDFQPWI